MVAGEQRRRAAVSRTLSRVTVNTVLRVASRRGPIDLETPVHSRMT